MMFTILSLFIMTLFCSNVASSSSYKNSTVQNTAVVTYIDITSQLVIVQHNVTISRKLESIESYVYVVDPLWEHSLSYIDAYDMENDTLTVLKIPSGNFSLYQIFFKQPIPPGESTSFRVSLVFTNYLQSYPKTVRQGDKHTVLFVFNIYYYSFYFTKQQVTYLHIGTFNVVHVDGAMYSNDENSALRYGPYYNVPQESQYQSNIHYENSSPFLKAETLERIIQISHWGYITVRDRITIVHSGPMLKGPYERPVPHAKVSKDTRIEKFVTTLPGNAMNIYMKDDIGLIWSYGVYYDDSTDKIKVKVKPRYILYGGWKVHYEIGYNLPISAYTVFSKDQVFTLSAPVVDNIFESMFIEDAKISFILPEAASFLEIGPTFELRNNTKYCYFFDVVCREVISFKLKNLVQKHILNVLVTYSHSHIFLLLKPLAITVFLYAIFTIFIFYLRFCKGDADTVDTPSKKYSLQQPQPIFSKQVKQTKNSNKKKNKHYKTS